MSVSQRFWYLGFITSNKKIVYLFIVIYLAIYWTRTSFLPLISLFYPVVVFRAKVIHSRSCVVLMSFLILVLKLQQIALLHFAEEAQLSILIHAVWHCGNVYSLDLGGEFCDAYWTVAELAPSCVLISLALSTGQWGSRGSVSKVWICIPSLHI